MLLCRVVLEVKNVVYLGPYLDKMQSRLVNTAVGKMGLATLKRDNRSR